MSRIKYQETAGLEMKHGQIVPAAPVEDDVLYTK